MAWMADTAREALRYVHPDLRAYIAEVEHERKAALDALNEVAGYATGKPSERRMKRIRDACADGLDPPHREVRE